LTSAIVVTIIRTPANESTSTTVAIHHGSRAPAARARSAEQHAAGEVRATSSGAVVSARTRSKSSTTSARTT
jgi:hypothetical protein